jgi:predicted N-acetyltransferase YhbS
MKYSFSDNPALSERLFDLLDTVFPGVRQVAQNARALGAPWESVSTPFIHFEQGRAIAHVGVIELSLVLLGRTVTVGSIHGVATHPEARRRGHFRRLMEEVLQYCAGRYETLMLTTEHPEYFAPFGFRVVKEHLFTVKCDSAGGSDGFRLLDTSQTGDIALLHRLLETRQAVSQVVGAVNEKAVFCFNEGSRPLHYAADLDVIACLELEEGRLKLFDIVGPKIPPLARVLERIPQRLDEAAICFSADQLAVEAEATPYVLDHDGPSYLMVRGPFAAEGQPFTLPRSART